ncbi:MAG: hypothetical protein GY820_39450 [Gammaproteobacteria bacterium]|nr:hypothetical protein [Gammaproteobacteria bacterium]
MALPPSGAITQTHPPSRQSGRSRWGGSLPAHSIRTGSERGGSNERGDLPTNFSRRSHDLLAMPPSREARWVCVLRVR